MSKKFIIVAVTNGGRCYLQSISYKNRSFKLTPELSKARTFASEVMLQESLDFIVCCDGAMNYNFYYEAV